MKSACNEFTKTGEDVRIREMERDTKREAEMDTEREMKVDTKSEVEEEAKRRLSDAG